MIGLLPFETTLVCRLSSRIMPLEASCQGILGFPVSKFKLAHTYLNGVAKNAVIKNSYYSNKKIRIHSTFFNGFLV